MYSLRVCALFIGLLSLAWLAAFIADRIWPEPAPPEALFPRVGQVLSSRSEGFTARILRVDGDRVWIESTLAPHAPGPPPHVHTTFVERFMVVKGHLSLRVGNEVKVIGEGESFQVSAGVPHQPYNATDEEVILRGPLTPEYALPRDFMLFLSQVYGFIDESPAHARPPALLLQMSLLSLRYDTWLAAPPIFIQRMQAHILHPVARFLGYRSYYPRFAPQDGALLSWKEK